LREADGVVCNRSNLNPGNLTVIQSIKLKYLLTLTAALALGANLAVADDTPLGKEMSSMNKSLRALKKQVDDSSKKDDSLALVAKMKKNLEESLKFDPAKTKDQPAAGKDAYLAKYKEQMQALGKSIDELEAAIKADKPEDAKKVFEKLSEQKEKGHKDFAPDE
jgi:hypothetical protein